MSNEAAAEVNVVFGATGGIGSQLCHALSNRGSKLLVVGRDPDKTAKLASEIGASHALLDGITPGDFETCMRAAQDEFGHVTGVANCIGSLFLQPAHRTSVEQWDETMTANLGSAFATVSAAAKTMRRTGGSVVLVSSAAALTGLPNHEAIAAAKAGIIGLTRSAAASYAGSGLRFNAVAPGLVKTGLTEQLWSNDVMAAGSVAMHALGRLGEPQDIASMIAYLLDPASNWITGQVVSVDGGLAHVRARSKR